MGGGGREEGRVYHCIYYTWFDLIGAVGSLAQMFIIAANSGILVFITLGIYCCVPARWGLQQTHPALRAATRHGVRGSFGPFTI